MLVILLMLLLPGVVYVLTFRLSGRFKPGLRLLYRLVGGIVAILGSGVSLYFAAYSGDQGGIAAFYFQFAVILVYAIFSVFVVVLDWATRGKKA